MVGYRRILYLTFDFLDPIFSGNGTLSQIQIFGLLERNYEIMVLCPDSGIINNEMKKWIKRGSLTIIPVHINSKKDLSPSCDWEGFYSQSLERIRKIDEFKPHLIINPDWHTIEVAIYIKNALKIPLIGQFFRIFSYKL